MKKYRIEKGERIGPDKDYFVWILVESNIDEDGFHIKEKVIADFGNTKSIANTLNVKAAKQFFENRAFWE